MFIDYLERLRSEPKSVRLTATYVLSISLTAIIAFVWLVAQSVAPAPEGTASATKGVGAISERFEAFVAEEAPDEGAQPPHQTIEEILQSRARAESAESTYGTSLPISSEQESMGEQKDIPAIQGSDGRAPGTGKNSVSDMLESDTSSW